MRAHCTLVRVRVRVRLTHRCALRAARGRWERRAYSGAYVGMVVLRNLAMLSSTAGAAESVVLPLAHLLGVLGEQVILP